MKLALDEADNCTVIYRPGQSEYVTAVKEFSNERFDIIIIDGRDRKDCIKHILPYLSDEGVVLLDDSWQEKFDEVFEYFKKNGFRELSFSGLKPGGMIVQQTTVFYRSDRSL